MAVLAIELHDAGLTAVHQSRPKIEVLPPSPGFALLDGDAMLTGAAAFRRFRLKPRWTTSRFWESLDTTPVPRPFPRNLTQADLVHAHLEGFWRAVESGVDDVILAVPGWYSDEQLGLILGIARSCSIPAHGMIDSALAAASTVEAGEKRIVLDIHLHRTAATSLYGGNALQRGRIEVHPRLGLISLWDAWVKLVADLFVRQTRFDPLHLAETEQGLYLSLPQWLERLREQEATRLVMEAGGKDYSIEVHQDDVTECVRTQYEEIRLLVESVRGTDENVTLLLSHRLSRLPGLMDLLSREPEVKVIALPPAAAATGALQARDRVLVSNGREELTFVTRLPMGVSGEMNRPVGALSKGSRPIATHILEDGIARPVTSEPFYIGGTTCRIHRREDGVIVETAGEGEVMVNGRAIAEKSSLYAGDRVRVGRSGEEVQLIHVKD
jgi:hypothetical protein